MLPAACLAGMDLRRKTDEELTFMRIRGYTVDVTSLQIANTKTPVIIPAYRAESTLGGVLATLPRAECEPIIAFNGETSTYAHDIADSFGARQITSETQGKLPAIQDALRWLGGYALEPLVILDADTKPLAPRRWIETMVRSLHPEVRLPASVGGPIVFYGKLPVAGMARTAIRSVKTLLNRDGSCYGPNHAIRLQSRRVLNEVLDMPNYWPGEDRAIADVIIRNGGSHFSSMDLRAVTSTPLSASYPNLLARLVRGRQWAGEYVVRNYIDRGPKEAKSYLALPSEVATDQRLSPSELQASNSR